MSCSSSLSMTEARGHSMDSHEISAEIRGDLVHGGNRFRTDKTYRGVRVTGSRQLDIGVLGAGLG